MTLKREEIEQIAQRVVQELESDKNEIVHWFLESIKRSDDVLLVKCVEDVAFFNKVRITGPPAPYQPNPTAMNAGKCVVFSCYTFIPRSVVRSRKYPLLVLPHSGVHSSFNSLNTNIIRELMLQEYIVIAPEYRGSTGYGKAFYQLIDYGGTESLDTYAARNHMIETCPYADPDRVGILGWSHGGMHTLFNIFKFPDAYQAAFASVPVSDLVARMGYRPEGYRKLFFEKYHIGQTVFENVAEYRKRSPVWNVTRLKQPLLIHSTENDDDVNVLEVEHLVKSLIAEGNVPEKDFWYKIHPPTPGAHSFDRLDTPFSKGIRGEAYAFLARYLEPPGENPLSAYIGTPNPLGREKGSVD